MRKLTIFLIPLMAGLMVVPAMALDRAGQGDTTIVNDLITRIYDEGFNWASEAQRIKLVDTSYAIRTLSSSAEHTGNKYYIERDTIIVTAANTELYNLPNDFNVIPYERPEFGVTSIKKSTGKEVGMKPITIGDIDMYDTADQPIEFQIRKSQIYIQPVVQANDSIKVYYSARSNTLSALTDTLNIHREYMDYLVYHALEKIFRAILLREGAQEYMLKQLADFTMLKEKEAIRLALRQQSILEISKK